ncbi:peptidylprolyl isomerase [Cohnella fermenti]|uniref:peptidylprolyl isomerase n=1 Tax=Cohnella fermenti TaxID=2565925 RepID=A0A4S4BSP4_9BACL|nr:peptidylprolyl isomerase [Cohnella fermenti]THF77520.1 hypothetical protein E6C55_16005 [Cohnella fermenti]
MSLHKIISLSAGSRAMTLGELLGRLRIDAPLADLERCRSDLAVESWAESLGIEADNAALQQAVNRFRKERGLFTAAKTSEWLAERGASFERLVSILRPEALKQALAERLVSDEEIERHFREFARMYDKAELSVLSTGLFGIAQELRFRLQEGESFHLLAREYSSDEATARAGGYAGLVGREDLTPEAAADVFGAEAGSVLGPYGKKNEYLLYLVEKLYPAELNEAVEADIRSRLLQDKLNHYRRTLDVREHFGSLGEG